MDFTRGLVLIVVGFWLINGASVISFSLDRIGLEVGVGLGEGLGLGLVGLGL